MTIPTEVAVAAAPLDFGVDCSVVIGSTSPWAAAAAGRSMEVVPMIRPLGG
jgi:hypothetical protein